MRFSMLRAASRRTSRSGPGPGTAARGIPGYRATFAGLSAGGRRILAAQLLRSVGQGALVTTFAIYLHGLGYASVTVGAILSAGVVANIVLSVVLGPLADRWRRKPMLIAGELVVAVVAVAAAASSALPVVILAAMLGGFGRGRNGAATPLLGPENAWLATQARPALWPRLFALTNAATFAGAGIGAVVSTLVLGGANGGGGEGAHGPRGAATKLRPLTAQATPLLRCLSSRCSCSPRPPR